MEIPPVPPCPPKLKAYLELLRQAALTGRPIAGKNMTTDEHPGKGTVTNADDCAPCP
jgi:hypothetical protein